VQGFSPVRTRERDDGTDLLPGQQNLKLLSEKTGITNGHFLVHNGENCECGIVQYIHEVSLCAVLVGKWEITVLALIYVGTYYSFTFHFPTVTAHPQTFNKQTGLLRLILYQ